MALRYNVIPPPGKTVPVTVPAPQLIGFSGPPLPQEDLAGPEKPLYVPDTLPPLFTREAGSGLKVNVDESEIFQLPVPLRPGLSSEHINVPLPLPVSV